MKREQITANDGSAENLFVSPSSWRFWLLFLCSVVFFLIVVKTWIASGDIRLFHSALFLASAHTFVRNYCCRLINLLSVDNDTMILLSPQPSDNKEHVTNGWFILKLSLPFYKNGYRKYFLVYDIELREHYVTFKLLRSEKI